jgi:nucleotide-binding universal stress UspA family protein
MTLFSNLLVAVSGSEASLLAAKYAVVMAKLYKCSLTAVYVVDIATIRQLTLSRIFVSEESREYERSLEENGQRYLAFVEELARAKGVKIDKEIRRGAIHTEILNAAEDHETDLIVLGGWERERSSREILSHIPLEIMIGAQCPVYVVKEPNVDHIYRNA